MKEKILLSLDSCTVHEDIPKLTNIKIIFLLPNTTSKLQSLEQGIIQNFKICYRQEVVLQFLNDMECQTTTKISVLDAILMITKTWNNITETTIFNYLKKSGFEISDLKDAEDSHNLAPQGTEKKVGKELVKHWTSGYRV